MKKIIVLCVSLILLVGCTAQVHNTSIPNNGMTPPTTQNGDKNLEDIKTTIPKVPTITERIESGYIYKLTYAVPCLKHELTVPVQTFELRTLFCSEFKTDELGVYYKDPTETEFNYIVSSYIKIDSLKNLQAKYK